ncbi:MAG: galactose mutarotase [Reichenbachiella sp.]
MNIEKSEFGKYKDQVIDQYTLTNDKGMSVKVMTYGATVTSIKVPDSDGAALDLVCGFDDFDTYFSDAYQANAPYFGGTIGRYASRLKDGKFTIDGTDYTVAVNDGSNHLHGGIVGFDKRVWSAQPLDAKDSTGVKFTLVSNHMDEGYPGDLTVSVSYRLDNDNQLSIDYEGTTTKETPLSLTNHTYFNLSGFKSDIKNHTAKINSNTFLQPDETNVPVGEETAVNDGPANLQEAKLLGDQFEQMETGFEHYYSFENGVSGMQSVAEFVDQDSGRKLEVLTDEPGALFYTGYFTSDELERGNGQKFGRYRGFCCETSRFPNGPNLDGVTNATLKPEEKYKSKTIYKLNF